jgi:hypothetical protein
MFEASEKFDRYTSNRFQGHYTKGIREWFFDLKTKEWRFKAQHYFRP